MTTLTITTVMRTVPNAFMTTSLSPVPRRSSEPNRTTPIPSFYRPGPAASVLDRREVSAKYGSWPQRRRDATITAVGSDNLRTYRAKRDFATSPEPAGGIGDGN